MLPGDQHYACVPAIGRIVVSVALRANVAAPIHIRELNTFRKLIGRSRFPVESNRGACSGQRSSERLGIAFNANSVSTLGGAIAIKHLHG